MLAQTQQQHRRGGGGRRSRSGCRRCRRRNDRSPGDRDRNDTEAEQTRGPEDRHHEDLDRVGLLGQAEPPLSAVDQPVRRGGQQGGQGVPQGLRRLAPEPHQADHLFSAVGTRQRQQHGVDSGSLEVDCRFWGTR